MIVCGWCHAETGPGTCALCGRDPALPWTQRGQLPPTAHDWQQTATRRRLEDARRHNPDATVDQLAEILGVSPRTVRRWQEMSGPRPSMPPLLT